MNKFWEEKRENVEMVLDNQLPSCPICNKRPSTYLAHDYSGNFATDCPECHYLGCDFKASGDDTDESRRKWKDWAEHVRTAIESDTPECPNCGELPHIVFMGSAAALVCSCDGLDDPSMKSRCSLKAWEVKDRWIDCIASRTRSRDFKQKLRQDISDIAKLNKVHDHA